MINIGIVTAHHYPRLGGMEYVTHFMADYLNRMEDIKVSVACNSLRGIAQDFEYPYACYRSKSLSILTPWLFKQNQLKMIKKEQVNILHGPMLHGGGNWAQLLSEQLKLPFIAHSHGSDVQIVKEIGYGALLNYEKKKTIKNVINKAHKLIAVSHINKQNMIDLGATPENIAVVHNGIQIKEINSIPYKDYRAAWGIMEDDFAIITVGRNRPVKRMDLLFEALKKLKSYKKIKCICVGPIENLRQLAAKYNIEDKVILLGNIPAQPCLNLQPPYPELINAYRSANLYISTSYVESFGSAAADALACGIPVVIGKKHGVRDIIEENKTGMVMEKETPSSLAELILEMYNQQYKLKEQSNNIMQSVAHLTWEEIAFQMANVYKTII